MNGRRFLTGGAVLGAAAYVWLAGFDMAAVSNASVIAPKIIVGPVTNTHWSAQAICSRLRDLQESSVCASWRSAFATEDASFWSKIQAALAFVSALGLIITLCFNYIALRRARESESDTRKALAAGERTATAMGQLAEASAKQASLLEAQTRANLSPVLDFENVMVEWRQSDNKVVLHARLCNRGFAIARHVKMRTEIQAIWPPIDPDTDPEKWAEHGDVVPDLPVHSCNNGSQEWASLEDMNAMHPDGLMRIGLFARCDGYDGSTVSKMDKFVWNLKTPSMAMVRRPHDHEWP